MTDWDNPFNLLTALFQSQIADTMVAHPDEMALWNESVEILWALNESLDHTPESMVGKKIFEWQRNILWAMTAVYGGAYEFAVRELRFMIEDAMQSLYIEKLMVDVSLDAKLKVLPLLEDRGTRGTQMIHKLKKFGIPGDIRKKLEVLYSDLSGYVHPSEEVTRSSLETGRFIFQYIDVEFNRCYELHKDTYDAIIALVLSFYPDAKTAFYDSIRDKLQNLDFRLTLLQERI